MKRKNCKAKRGRAAMAVYMRGLARRKGRPVKIGGVAYRANLPLSADKLTLSHIAVTCLDCNRCPKFAARMVGRWQDFAEEWGHTLC